MIVPYRPVPPTSSTSVPLPALVSPAEPSTGPRIVAVLPSATSTVGICPLPKSQPRMAGDVAVHANEIRAPFVTTTAPRSSAPSGVDCGTACASTNVSVCFL